MRRSLSHGDVIPHLTVRLSTKTRQPAFTPGLPGLVNADLSVVKSIPIRSVSDRFEAQLRAEFFNPLNRSNFLPPLNNLKLFDAAGTPVAGAGLLDTTATPSRQIQFALKLVW